MARTRGRQPLFLLSMNVTEISGKFSFEFTLVHSKCRNQQKQVEATTPFNGLTQDPKSPISSNAKASRRQSLTGLQVPERSRRSSIGGVSTDSCEFCSYENTFNDHHHHLKFLLTNFYFHFLFADGNENRNAKTPPPQVRASTKLTKRWL